MAQAEQDFERRIDTLEAIFRFADSFLSAEGIGDEHRFAVHFALEELFTNIVKYSKSGTGKVRIALGHAAGALTIRLTDFDVDPFDVTGAPEADVQASLEERTPGGLGLHLVRRLVDDVDYSYKNRTSIITLTKKLASGEA